MSMVLIFCMQTAKITSEKKRDFLDVPKHRHLYIYINFCGEIDSLLCHLFIIKIQTKMCKMTLCSLFLVHIQ